MQNRRKFFTVLTVSLVALGFVAGSALAEELLGVITKVDLEKKTLTVVEKGTDKEVSVKVNDDTVSVGKNGEVKTDLAKVSKQVANAIEKGRKGVNVKIEHKDGVASKITPAQKKKEAEKTQ